MVAKKVRQKTWPQARKVMARPHRAKYVRSTNKSSHCVFCEASGRGVSRDSLVLYQDDHAIVMLNKYPYNSGHLLVLPKRHCGDLLDLSENEYSEVQRQLRRAVEAVVKCYECAGYNLGLNQGRAAGAGIPEHLHWHIIPRWAGDTNFFPLIAESKVTIETLEQTYQRLKDFYL